MNTDLFYSLVLISSRVVFVPLAIGLFRLRALNFEQRMLTILLGVTALVELISMYFWYQSRNNLPVFHVYTAMQFVIIALLYKRKLEGLIPAVVFNVLTGCFIAFAVVNSAFLQSINTLNTNAIVLGGSVYILLSIAYFYKLLKDINYESLQKNPMFWISAGILIYFSSTLVLFVLGNRLIPESLQVRGAAWGLNALFNIFLNMFYVLALWVKPQT